MVNMNVEVKTEDRKCPYEFFVETSLLHNDMYDTWICFLK